MAILIPDSCPSKATAGEKRVYALLRDVLPDHFTAWYEPVVQGRYPDFTLLADDFGLLVLEVKGWYAGQIAGDRRRGRAARSEGGQDHVEMDKHPIRQVREYLFALMDELSRPEYAILLQQEGEHRGKPCFPCGFGVLLTNITRGQLDEAGLSPSSRPTASFAGTSWRSWKTAGDREVIRRLRRLFARPFPFDPLSEDQIQTLKGVVHREVVVKRRPATAAAVPAGEGPARGRPWRWRCSTRRQEQAARSLGAGHHVFFGIAGSGKTVLLLARAGAGRRDRIRASACWSSATTGRWPPT